MKRIIFKIKTKIIKELIGKEKGRREKSGTTKINKNKKRFT